ncbi:hypothetical protein AZE42_04797 [Rhizopogon vesiculosus]|uniref:Uncharacterized protein n=1 Tax=Rhizopogon vesiculosus TaxID=180088 RepID=A0A1J8Q7U0_9AGAM|nr:hypothetical protein AZE42_04797 [Rhizopogon vesiculosus]
MDRHLDPQLCKLIYASVVSVVSICGQFTTVLMATDGSPSEPKARWNAKETETHLLEHVSEIEDGGIFQSSTYNSLMSSAARAAEVSPAAAIIGMRESINRIGDILEKFGTSLAATSTPSASPIASSTISNIRPSTVERVMHVLNTEDADLPADEQAALMMIFSDVRNERAMEIYIGSAHVDVVARRIYIKNLIATRMPKQVI